MSKQTQQFKLYAAERAVNVGRAFRSLEEIQAWVDALREQLWWRQRYPEVKRIEVGPAIAGGRCGSVGWFEPEMGAGRIEMAPQHWSELVVVHEMSHVFASVHGSGAHDPIFARTFLNLTYFILGTETYQQLAAAFNDAEIDTDWEAPSPLVRRDDYETEE